MAITTRNVSIWLRAIEKVVNGNPAFGNAIYRAAIRAGYDGQIAAFDDMAIVSGQSIAELNTVVITAIHDLIAKIERNQCEAQAGADPDGGVCDQPESGGR